jgi:hypothetical protein
MLPFSLQVSGKYRKRTIWTELDANSGERGRRRSANLLILLGENGGADETRTRDLLRDRQLQKIYLVGPSSFVLRHRTRFWT